MIVELVKAAEKHVFFKVDLRSCEAVGLDALHCLHVDPRDCKVCYVDALILVDGEVDGVS